MPDCRAWPKISVVTPSYNQGQFIEETIRSVLLQGYPNLEYVLIDGGSTDESVDIIRKYSGHLAFWISEPDKGQVDAINKGFDKATGDIFGWINSDDFYYPGVFHVIARTFVDCPDMALIYGYEDDVDIRGRLIQPVFPTVRDARTTMLYFAQPLPQLACFWRSDAHRAVGGLNEALHYLLDYDFLLRLAYRFPSAYLHLRVGAFRKYPEQKTQMTKRVISEQYAVLAQFVNGLDIPPWKRQLLRCWHRALLSWRYKLGFQGGKSVARRLHKMVAWR
jgi:glycosyltransferase involved in cell wall biosynthesis